ncbi:MAG: rRNA pseudouridine synthase [Eubacterium sp.]|nr:rRNA pseudouridine synthase [Eubacterium sp.]
MAKIRLQKIIADSGYCSRRKAEQLIADGLVRVNGRPVTLGDGADPKTDIVTVGGERINAAETLRYIKLYKPRGYVTTMSDAHAEKPVTDLLDGIDERVYPVGRLDKNSEGLLILTNDGNLANAIMHPSHKIKKRYRVTVRGDVNEDKLLTLASGVKIDSGVTAPCTITILAEEENRTVLEFVISEGKNRQIRKMCEAVKLEVVRLKRSSVANIKLGMLKPGEWRDLTEQELKGLFSQLGLNAKKESK